MHIYYQLYIMHYYEIIHRQHGINYISLAKILINLHYKTQPILNYSLLLLKLLHILIFLILKILFHEDEANILFQYIKNKNDQLIVQHQNTSNIYLNIFMLVIIIVKLKTLNYKYHQKATLIKMCVIMILIFSIIYLNVLKDIMHKSKRILITNQKYMNILIFLHIHILQIMLL